MESEFEPAVRMEETPEARIVIVDLPGFRREDLRLQLDNQGNLIISGERDVKEMGEITKAGRRLEKMQSGGHRFRKVIGVTEDVNFDGITAKLKDQVLRVSLPFAQKNRTSPTEAVNGGGKLHDVADLSEQSKPEERSSPVKQQGLTQERPAAVQNDQSTRLSELNRPEDYKAKATGAAEESKGSQHERKTEAPKHAQDFAQGEPTISTHTQAVSAEADSDRDQFQFIQSKSKPLKKDDKSYLPSPMDLEKRLQIPSSTIRSMMSNSGVVIVSTLLVLCAGMYLSYILKTRKTD